MLKQDALSKLKPGKRGIGLILSLLLAAMLMMAPAVSGTMSAQAKTYRFAHDGQVIGLHLAMGKSRTVRTGKSFAEVHVGNSAIADILPLTSSSFYVMGKKIGTTSLSIYTKERRLLGVFDLEVTYDIANLRRRLKQNLRGARIAVTSLNGKIHLTGKVPNAPAATRAVHIAHQFAPKADVMNSLTITSSQQVMLEVRFIEASRTAGRELGIGLNGKGKGSNGFATGVGLLSNSTPFGSFVANILSGGFTADILIDALEERGLARRLAEPNLTALSGDTASFLAGGEFPFPVGTDNGEVKIEFKKFGVGLSFTPTVLAGGLINLEIEPEVSQLDPTTSLRISGFEIPSLIVRRAHTTIELRDGQSFAIAGLLQVNNSKTKSQLPWLGSVPVIGALFRSSSFQKKQTDLVIIVTPRLVRPAAPGTQLASPLDKRRPANDLEFFLGGKMDVSKKAVRYYSANGRYGYGAAGHILTARPRPVTYRPRPAASGPKSARAKAALPKPRPAPVRTASRKPVPAKTAPAKAAPVKTASRKSAPVKAAPAKAGPLKAAPAKTSPVKAAPGKAVPVKAAPAIGSNPVARRNFAARTNFSRYAGRTTKINLGVDAHVLD
jgi:pilus assembly protein CpaC